MYSFLYELFLGPGSDSTNTKIDSKEHIEPSRAPSSFTAVSDKGEELFLKWQFFQVAHQKRRNLSKIGGSQRARPHTECSAINACVL